MAPVRFLLGFHLHQPVGNFDHVFQEHVDRVYTPLLLALERRAAFPVSFHISGPLIEWLERHAPAYLERIGRLAADRQIELLAAGWTEPVLGALLRTDRIEQVQWMREELRRRFGVEPHGLWLTERVWSPELAADLVDAGVRYVLVDDRHFLASGIPRAALHRPQMTEAEGRRLTVFAIDERLRYLIPFQPPEASGQYLRELHHAGQPLAILADDGEKFGGWPGTYEWVYERGWLDRFFDQLDELRTDGIAGLGTFSQALQETPSGGLVYLPTASYREMEGWALPAPAAIRLEALERELGEEWLASERGALVRGSHWRNFLAKYPESNRMHKKAQHLSLLCRQRGNPAEVRRAVARAQCNDAYWHGVFGGLYLPHLREAIWLELARAEASLRHAEPLTLECLDFDFDGHDELWAHGAHGSLLVSPARGGAVEELTRFGRGRNLCDTLTRRWEAYHDHALHATAGGATHGGTPSIHDLEQQLRLEDRPAVDLDERSMLRDRILGADVTREQYERADYPPVASFTQTPLQWASESLPDGLVIAMHEDTSPYRLAKRLRFGHDASLAADYEWNATGDTGQWFTVELTLAEDLPIEHDAEEEWRHTVETVAKSERGFDRTRQGTGVLLRWPVARGKGWLRVA
ncbi:MAG TPA: alpha-amylase/4-alpha-glucanotransferase domain-containing protein [Gemmatimonadales bacterium]|nr:alpha-amylase/4-alpha-glucanotransferase domain-containing protein [Gemmatimonadales bacterium]